MKNPMKVCPACGAEIAGSAKSCPHCGAKNKKPIYKKWWFWLLVVIIVGTMVSSGGNSGENTSDAPVSTESEKASEPITYTKYNVTDLFDALESNALKAEKSFLDQYVELEGYLSVIDSDGDYISIGADPNDYEYLFQTVNCDIQTDEQLNQILEMSVKDPIVVRGQITEIGEIISFTLDIDSIN